jgi:hypothetical protein
MFVSQISGILESVCVEPKMVAVFGLVAVEMVLQCGNSNFVGFPLPLSIPPSIRTILSPCDSPGQAVFVGDRPFAGEAVLTSHSYLETG